MAQGSAQQSGSDKAAEKAAEKARAAAATSEKTEGDGQQTAPEKSAEQVAQDREAADKAALDAAAAEQKEADERTAAEAKAQEEAGGGAKPSSTRAATGRAAAPGDSEADKAGLTFAGGNPRTDSGPGTGAYAPPESTYRMPSTVISDQENPLDPPSDQVRQREPAQGYNESSTDHVYAAMGGRTMAGEDFSAFVGEDGKRLRASSLFDESDDTKTWVVAKTRAFEEFFYPNTTEKARRLVLVPGQKIPRAQADLMKQAISDAPTPLAEV